MDELLASPLLELISASHYPAPHSLLNLVVLLSWVCYVLTPSVTHQFKSTLKDYNTIYQLCTSAGLIFAPDLFTVLTAATPPTIAWYMQLPRLDASKKWGVYLLVLQKPGCLDLIYVGSATDSTKGISSRFSQYDRIERGVMPKYVLQALDDGYRIVSKGLLVKAAIPPPAAQIPLRALFIAIETVFTFAFWALRVPDKGDEDYYMGEMCL